jgi:hypothetical protein
MRFVDSSFKIIGSVTRKSVNRLSDERLKIYFRVSIPHMRPDVKK